MTRLSHKKRIDLLVWLALIALAAIVSVAFKVDLIVSVLLYFGLPSFYLWIREKKHYQKILLGSLIIGVLLGMAWNILAEITNTYRTHYAFFPFDFTVIGATSFGDFVYGFFILLGVITFYEHFFDREKVALSKYWVFALGLGLVTFFLTASLLVVAPETLHAEYSYVVLGSLIPLPLLYLIFCKRSLIKKVVLMGFFFFILNLLFEITAVHLTHWEFPGTYLGMLGWKYLQFPIEELVFWIVFGTPTLILTYEFLIDDGK